MSKLRIALTTGDVDGIGLEVTTKALEKIGPQKGVQFFLFRAPGKSKDLNRLKKFKSSVATTLASALKDTENDLVHIESDLSPAHWVELAAKACLTKKLSALATAPLSKVTIQEAGFQDLGHTDILKRISKVKTVHMTFLGDKFNVLLATGHLPLTKVPKSLNFSVVAEALLQADGVRKSLPKPFCDRPVAVLGLNPHAGESGLIGVEEALIFPHLQEFAKEKGIPYTGPLVPDAAFFADNWKKFSIYVALYHDQGLIPFKMIHGQDSGVHISAGLPIIRTSVDHGTAKDIFGKNKANPSSMVDAIRWSIKLARLKES